jgi:hypothetical protein
MCLLWFVGGCLWREGCRVTSEGGGGSNYMSAVDQDGACTYQAGPCLHHVCTSNVLASVEADGHHGWRQDWRLAGAKYTNSHLRGPTRVVFS